MIFIVDDDPSVRGSLLRLIRAAGHSAAAFETAEQFLTEAAAADCRCVVIDIHLPGMNGLELQRELRRRPVAPPVVMMTAFEEPGARREAMDGGALALLVKPFDDAALLQLVAAAVKSKQLEQPLSQRGAPQ